MFHVITANRDGSEHIFRLENEEALHTYLFECFKHNLKVPENVKIYRVQEVQACLKTVMTLSDTKTS